MKSIFLIICFFITFIFAADPKIYSVLYENQLFNVVEGLKENAVAIAHLDEAYFKEGWNKLKISNVKNNPSSGSIKMKAAGYLEGFIRQKDIFNAYYNFANGTGTPTSTQVQKFITDNDKWIRQNAFAGNANTYWSTIGLLLNQYDGIIEGYQRAAPSAQYLSSYQLMVFALQYELGDIAIAVTLKNTFKGSSPDYHSLIDHLNKVEPFFTTNRAQTKVMGDYMGEHCSCFVKLTNKNAKLMSSHDTWSTFNSMLRDYKHYDLYTGKVQFSSFPALPYSGDDFYINDKKLVVMETTNSIFNNSLYSATTTTTVPYWLRVQVATYLATNGVEWHKYFEMYNNGGYNNQWIIVDYNMFTPGSSLKPNALVIGEQVPGFYVYDDQTNFLTQNGYWASYNIPFYPFIYNISGYVPMYQKYGNAYSWSMCARAQIYRRDQNNAQDVQQFQYIQRYNQYQIDPLSLEDACRGISARCDLNNPWSNNTLNGWSAFGGIDSKMTDENMVSYMGSLAVCGPTWASQPIFWWSDSQALKYQPQKGLAPMYAFDWVEMN